MFAHRGRDQSGRFSLLLLDEGECYLGDYVGLHQRQVASAAADDADADTTPSELADGTLRVGSHSITFEPDDESLPIIRLRYEKIETIEPIREDVDEGEEDGEREEAAGRVADAGDVEPEDADSIDENEPTPEEVKRPAEENVVADDSAAADGGGIVNDVEADLVGDEQDEEPDDEDGKTGKKKKGFGKKGFGKGLAGTGGR